MLTSDEPTIVHLSSGQKRKLSRASLYRHMLLQILLRLYFDANIEHCRNGYNAIGFLFLNISLETNYCSLLIKRYNSLTSNAGHFLLLILLLYSCQYFLKLEFCSKCLLMYVLFDVGWGVKDEGVRM